MCCDKYKFDELSKVYTRSHEKIKAFAIEKNKKLLEFRKEGKHIHKKFQKLSTIKKGSSSL